LYVLLNKYQSGDQFKKNDMGGTCGMYGGQERCIQDLKVISEGKETLEEPRRRLEDNTEMNLQDAGWTMNWIAVAQNRGRCRSLVNAVINFGFRKMREI
jgi:hypothetical protein